MRTKLTAALGALTGFTLIALSSLALSPTLASAKGFDAVASRIANHQAQGWESNRAPLDILERRIRNGQRVYVSCSISAELAYRAAKRMGLPARRVSVLTNRKFDGYNDGHAMVEVKLGGRWVLYDITMDRVAVDRDGRRVGLAHQMKASKPRWRMISTDSRRWNMTGLDAGGRASMRRVLAMGADRWYRHVMGVALVETEPGVYAYHGTGYRSPRVEAVWPGHYVWVNARTWRQISR